MRRSPENVYEFSLPGSGGLRMREVRVPLADPAAATCSCADYVVRRRTCKHIAADLTAASRALKRLTLASLADRGLRARFACTRPHTDCRPQRANRAPYRPRMMGCERG